MFHANVGRGAHHAGSVGGQGPADIVSCRCGGEAAAASPPDQPPADHRSRAIALGNSRDDREREEQHPHPRSKLSDPDLVALLRERRDEGITVTVLGKEPIRGFEPHGKMMIVDEARAVLGSTALSTLSLDFRREVSIVIHDPGLVKQLNMSYQQLSLKAGAAAARLPGDRTA